MPIGKIQRKPSNETLSSMDSTIDSRISSTDIPKMELLKINYVHQCKQALMHKSDQQQRLQKHNQTPPPMMLPQTAQNYKFAAFKKIPLTNPQQNISKPLKQSVLPPPTIESWQFLQNKRAINSPPKYLLPPPAQLPASDINCRHSATSSNCSASDSDPCNTDSTLSPGCERSNSWDYRTKCNTRDIRRDMARAGIKSRADRIARIEHTDCDHRKQDAVAAAAPTPTLPTTNSVSALQTTKVQRAVSADVVTKINQMFESAAKQKQQETELRRRTPPQPKRQAPLAPTKLPNMRTQAFPVVKSLASKHMSANDDCYDCSCESPSPPPAVEQRTSSLGNRNRATQSDGVAGGGIKHISRIPKPISGNGIPNDSSNRASTNSAMLFNEANEQLQRKIRQIFEQDGARHLQDAGVGVKSKPTSSKSTDKEEKNKQHAKLGNVINGLDQQLLRNARLPATGNHQKVKAERIHIRKKRQPLLIINQLTNEQSTKDLVGNAAEQAIHCTEMQQHADEPNTCGYKNCNFSNCPMSAKHANAKCTEVSQRLKRLSLESNSDSGISSSDQQQLKENNLKNIEKCTDCKEIFRKHDAKSDKHKDYSIINRTTTKSNAQDKLTDAAPIKIVIGKNVANDPNDVQNFAKKNLTKATTDELLTAALNNSINTKGTNSIAKSKQCNIENDRKNNENRNKFNNLRKQTIRIDDDWVADADDGISNIDDYMETDSLMLPPPNKYAKDNSAVVDNSVKIFVRSSAANHAGSAAIANRASSLSTTSFASQNSTCSSQHSCVTATSSTGSSASTSTTSSSGCGGCSAADSQSLCESEQDCCCHLAATTASGNKIIAGNNSHACSSSAHSVTSYDTCASTSQLGCDLGGVFWNSSCFSNEADPDAADADQCFCSLSSCDEDNCSYYEGDNVVVDTLDNTCCDQVYLRRKDHVEIDRVAAVAAITHHHRGADHQQQLLQRKHQRHMLRNGGVEEVLLRNKKLLRKTDVIHDLRPRSMDGVVDSGVSLNGDIGSSPDSIEHMQNQQDSEARRLKRGHVLTELLETERIYVSEMSSLLKGYCDQMQSEEMMHLVPASLQGKQDILFGNLHELYTFHNEVFLKDLENCISTTELVALCFVQRRDTFYRLYSFYCQNIPRSERLRETLVDTHLFLQECQKRLGHKLPLAAYLLKPVQRITKYQLLLKDLLRFSDSGSCTKELQKALDCMLIVLKCVNDSMHQVAITGFPSDLSQQGELLLQDSFQVWTEAKKEIRMRIKPQQRHIFLYQKSMLFCKQTSKTGHNKSTYQFKHYLKMSQIGLTESVRGDVKRFEVWLQGRQEVHTIQAPTIEIKNKWVAEIKRVLLNQLEELKGEKIKQYGLSHRGLRQTTSWDTPNILLSTPHRTISCDGSSESSNRNSNCSSSGDDNCPTPGACSSVISADKDGAPDACGWSSDYSNSEDEMSMIEDNSTPGSKFIALADYVAMGHSEVSMREGDTVELLKVGCAGWWFVRVLDHNAEGWAPAAYLESFNRKSSRSSSRNQERVILPKLIE